MLSNCNPYKFFKVFALMTCCVITTGTISTIISNQTKAASNRYFSSRDNPLKDLLDALPSSGALTLSPALLKDNQDALLEASKKINTINNIGFAIDATAQLLAIVIHSFLLTKSNHYRKQKTSKNDKDDP